MLIEILWVVVNYCVALPLAFAWGVTGLHFKAAVSDGQRYILATRGITLTIALVGTDLFLATLSLYDNDYLNAGGFTAVSLLILWCSKRFFDNDNWFNRQLRKFKNGLKNLGERLRSLASPLPSPA